LDQRGHGSNGHPGVYSFELLCGDLLGFVDQLGLDRSTLIGHSMGANVAWLFVQEHSDRVERLVIEDTAPPSKWHTYPEVPETPPEPVTYTGKPAAPYSSAQQPGSGWWDQLSTIAVPTLLTGTPGDEELGVARAADRAAVVQNC
jgi:esterase